MDLATTLGIAAGLLTVAVFAGWRGSRPPNPHRGPRLVPWRPIMAATAAAAVYFLVHAASLVGLSPGVSPRP